MSDPNYFARYGAIPNSTQKKKAMQMGMVADIDRLTGNATPWDSADKPSVTSWTSYKPYLQEEAQRITVIREAGKLEQWWSTAQRLNIDIKSLFLESQGGKGSCAGVSMFERCYLTALLKQIGAGAEMEPERINPMVSYAQSLGCNRDGERIPNGQTIAAVLQAGAEIGTYPVKSVGEYDDQTRYKSDWDKATSEAEKRQMGVCPLVDENGNSLDANEMYKAITLALKANKVVEIGNDTPVVANMKTDSNGVSLPQMGGYWMHATCLTGHMVINGENYYRWENSHGYIYKNNDNSPGFGCWFSEPKLKMFLNGNYLDAGIITYVEAPRTAPKTNLNTR